MFNFIFEKGKFFAGKEMREIVWNKIEFENEGTKNDNFLK